MRDGCKKNIVHPIVIGLAMLAVPGNITGGVEIRVDCSRQIGHIRPLHGVNNGPVNFGELVDLSRYYRELAIPLARLHDSEWPDSDIVDIHAIFPDFKADPAIADNYRFSATDDYIRAVINTGAGIVYRLGESIETTRRKYHVAPPADYNKWTAVCLGIIRHYNEGWADGFHHGIRYWEIWNEPENRPNMWTGTDQDYYRLYATAAGAIKARFPDVLVGGPSVGNPGELIGRHIKPSSFLEGFLNHCRKNAVPLDFFSWHTYSDDPRIYAGKAHAIRSLLNEYGFAKTEIHLNEWNFLPENDWTAITAAGQGIRRKQWFEQVAGPSGAAFVACTLSYIQDSPVDVANYYSGDTNLFGLFDRYGVPRKTFYAMKAFKMLLDTPLRVQVSGDTSGVITVCAGISRDRTRLTVLMSNFRSEEKKLRLRIDGFRPADRIRWDVYRLDADHNLARIDSAVTTEDIASLLHPIEAPCVLVFRLGSATEP